VVVLQWHLLCLHHCLHLLGGEWELLHHLHLLEGKRV